MTQFLIDNQNVFICIGVLVTIILTAKYVIPYVQNKNWINNDTIENTKHMLELYELLNSIIKTGDKYKSDTLMIYNACVAALNYIESVMDVTSEDETKKIIRETVEKVLAEMNIEIDERKKTLIELGISNAFEKSKR